MDFPIKNGDFHSYVSLKEGMMISPINSRRCWAPGEHDLGAQHGGDQARGHTFGTFLNAEAEGVVVVVGYNMYVIYIYI